MSWSAPAPIAAICNISPWMWSREISRTAHHSIAPSPIARRCFISLRTTASERSSRSSCIEPMWRGRAISSAPPAGPESHASSTRAASPRSACPPTAHRARRKHRWRSRTWLATTSAPSTWPSSSYAVRCRQALPWSSSIPRHQSGRATQSPPRQAGWSWTPRPGGCPHTSTRDSTSYTSMTSLPGTCWRFIAGEPVSATFLAART